jgi:predicted transposase YdaD
MILSKYLGIINEINSKPMPIQVDIRKTFLYKWGREEGIKEGEQRGLVRGLKQGLKEGILGIVQAKFGAQKAKLIESFLEKVDDISHLKKIKRELIRAETREDFIKALKSSNSKNKDSRPKLT